MCSSVCALFDLKQKGLIHRAIKPQNIFTDEVKVKINDAAVETLINYLRKNSKKDRDEIFKWSPPESLKCGEVLDKSDAWSLGCVLFKLLYCGLGTPSETNKAMTVVRTKGEIPQTALEQLHKAYPSEPIDLIKGMIILDAEKRVGITQVFESAYQQSLMDRYDCERKLRRKRLMKPTSECNPPTERGLSAMLRFLTEEIENENCIAAALTWIAETHCRNEAYLPALLPLHVWRVFLVHKENPVIVQHGIAILTHCTSVGRMYVREPTIFPPNTDSDLLSCCDLLIDNSTYWNEITLRLVCDLATRHMDTLGVHINVLALLEVIFCPTTCLCFQKKTEKEYWARHGGVVRKVCEIGFSEIILKALTKVHLGNVDILRPALAVLWKLCIDDQNAKQFIEMGAFKLVYDTMFFFPKHPGIINQGALCLAALATEEALHEDMFTKVDVLPLLLNTIYEFCGYTDIFYNLMLCVNVIIRRSEEQILRFVQPHIKDQGRGLVALIFKAYAVHRDNQRIIAILVSTLEVVMGYDGILEALIDDLCAMKALLEEVCSRFPSVENLGDVARRTLEGLPEVYSAYEEEETLPTV
ncbi:unnamed protein product [Mesocestoides corti]|uniref:Protein kinase domain-containing protein n=2 Tax=Mesocestoides corti TaxID=53468 RepID=A0A0R3U3F5_MESCO|nr:unnamed protein product [Mesocestoides corti]